MLREAISNEYTDVTPSGIAASATLNDDSIDLTLVMKAAEEGQYRVGAFLIEDGSNAPQLDYSDNSENMTTHNNVVRTIVGRDSEGGFTGIDLGTVHKGQTSYTSQCLALKKVDS